MLKKGIITLGLAISCLLPLAYAEDAATETATAESVVLYVDINNDSAEKLADLLEGVGLVRAEAIVAYRDENGPFIAPEDLMNVQGIGPATLEKNRDRIQVGMAD
ncbi:MAG TPA: helix-hairpin-helix domain-containing protein [Saccharospirillum sp.]|nr:helix-hairpin-helix domain-containing protein [Saccharospirillum sp.]